MATNNLSPESKKTPILLLDDETELLDSLEMTLFSLGFENITQLNEPKHLQNTIEKNHTEILLLDENISGVSGSSLIEDLVQKNAGLQIIMLTANNEVDLVVKSMKAGAIDFLVKPSNSSRILSAILNAIKKITLIGEINSLKSYLTGKDLESPEDFKEIITKNEKMENLFLYMESISKTPMPILLSGETGVGKELFARAIHNSSKRKGSFVAFNAAGVDDQFFSDTLFGHVEGAFTNASENREGLIQKANDGTLFIDEIGDLPLSAQVKLLRLLQEHEYFPIGSDKAKQSQSKILCASNKNLEEEVKEKRFRSDLYYRLNSHVIRIPALRDRIEDIEVLLPAIIQKHAKKMKKNKLNYPKQLIPVLSHYSFPGNIRELEMVIIDAIAISKGNTIPMEPFLKRISQSKKTTTVKTNKNNEEQLELEEETIDQFPSLKEIEREHILKAIKLANDNQGVAARMLGMARQTLNKKLKEIKNEN